MKKYEVITENGTPVFEGTKRECNAYLKQALKKGSKPGFLKLEEIKNENRTITTKSNTTM